MSKKLSEDYLIERNNNFNTYSPKDMSYGEIRFFAIYQSRINSRDIKSAKVVISLEEFIQIANIKKIDITWIKEIAQKLLQRIVEIPTKKGVIYVQLFSRFEVMNIDGKWLIEIKAHDELLPFIFNMKSKYFKYKLWNALKLKTVYQVRLYELLKQFEIIKKRKMSLIELKPCLGLKPTQYKDYYNFKRRILEPSKVAIKDNTDIYFEYEEIEIGKGGKVTDLIFYIYKNNDYKDDLKIDKLVNTSVESKENSNLEMEIEENIDIFQNSQVKDYTPTLIENNKNSNKIQVLSNNDENNFNDDYGKILNIFDDCEELVNYSGNIIDIWKMQDIYEYVKNTRINVIYKQSIKIYLQSKILDMKNKMEKNPIYHPSAYLKKLIDIDIENSR